MARELKVEVFGIRDEAPVGTCSCGGECGSGTEKTMGELFDDFVAYLGQTDLGERVELRFVDVFEDDLTGYDTAHTMFKRGFALPLVGINGVMCYYGGIANELIYQKLKSMV